jgi:hypothetical protein
MVTLASLIVLLDLYEVEEPVVVGESSFHAFYGFLPLIYKNIINIIYNA